jgi:glyoxylase-like metal-dependent hydrolase (beta-lactamase superfamily II)
MNKTAATWLAGLALALAASSGVPTVARQGTPQPPIIKAGTTVKVSDHVWVIPDGNVGMVPNVGIVVGSRATLVVDTGMGPKNGETVLAEAAKVSRNAPGYLVTTHFHPEHTAGATVFKDANYVVSRIQQQDLDELEPQFIRSFSNMSAANADLLRDVVIRKGDTLFDREYSIDLGGVTVRLLAVGPTHTRGDTVAFVEPDRVLFSGDVVMGKNFLSFSNQSSPSAWLKAFDELDAFKPLKVVPSHREMGDASLIAADRELLKSLQARVQELKAQGQTAAQMVATLRPEFQQKYSDWANPNRLDATIRAFAAE